MAGRSSGFNVKDTYANYTHHMQNVCFSLGMPTSWYTPDAKYVAKGTKKRQDLSFRFPNYVRSRLLIRLVRAESAQSEFPHACLLSFLFRFMVPSETLQLRRSHRDDRPTEFPPQIKKALIGARLVKGRPFLAAKLSSRKYMTCGVIMKRPFFCGLNADTARLVCPMRPHVAGCPGSGSLWQASLQGG